MMKPNTIDSTRGKLNAIRGVWPRVCAETGLDYSWLTKFAQGKIPNPGFSKIETLNSYFAKLGSGETAKEAA